MALPLLAIPVLHSSGAWIASTAAGGYLAGTLSGTWLGAFVLGNSTLLGSLGLVSAAGVVGSSLTGGVAAAGSSIALGTGSILSSIGLGGIATKLGVAPAVTFLGITPIGWAIAGSTSSVLAAAAYFKARSSLSRINEERVKGGLNPTTWTEIIKDVKKHELNALQNILKMLEDIGKAVLSRDGKHVLIDGNYYLVGKLKYVIEKDGREVLFTAPKVGRKKAVLIIKDAVN